MRKLDTKSPIKYQLTGLFKFIDEAGKIGLVDDIADLSKVRYLDNIDDVTDLQYIKVGDELLSITSPAGRNAFIQSMRTLDPAVQAKLAEGMPSFDFTSSTLSPSETPTVQNQSNILSSYSRSIPNFSTSTSQPVPKSPLPDTLPTLGKPIDLLDNQNPAFSNQLALPAFAESISTTNQFKSTAEGGHIDKMQTNKQGQISVGEILGKIGSESQGEKKRALLEGYLKNKYDGEIPKRIGPRDLKIAVNSIIPDITVEPWAMGAIDDFKDNYDYYGIPRLGYRLKNIPKRDNKGNLTQTQRFPVDVQTYIFSGDDYMPEGLNKLFFDYRIDENGIEVPINPFSAQDSHGIPLNSLGHVRTMQYNTKFMPNIDKLGTLDEVKKTYPDLTPDNLTLILELQSDLFQRTLRRQEFTPKNSKFFGKSDNSVAPNLLLSDIRKDIKNLRNLSQQIVEHAESIKNANTLSNQAMSFGDSIDLELLRNIGPASSKAFGTTFTNFLDNKLESLHPVLQLQLKNKIFDFADGAYHTQLDVYKTSLQELKDTGKIKNQEVIDYLSNELLRTTTDGRELWPKYNPDDIDGQIEGLNFLISRQEKELNNAQNLLQENLLEYEQHVNNLIRQGETQFENVSNRIEDKLREKTSLEILEISPYSDINKGSKSSNPDDKYRESVGLTYEDIVSKLSEKNPNIRTFFENEDALKLLSNSYRTRLLQEFLKSQASMGQKFVAFPSSKTIDLIQDFSADDVYSQKAIFQSNDKTLQGLQKITGSKGTPYTDGNDNTWTIFEIPEKFFGDDVEIIEYKKGGKVPKHQNETLTDEEILELKNQSKPLAHFYSKRRDYGIPLGFLEDMTIKDYVDQGGYYSGLIESAFDDAKAFQTNWLNSPMYDKMLTESTKDANPGAFDKANIESNRQYSLDQINKDNQYLFFNLSSSIGGTALMRTLSDYPKAFYNLAHPSYRAQEKVLETPDDLSLKASTARAKFKDYLSDVMSEEIGHLTTRPRIDSLESPLFNVEDEKFPDHYLIPKSDVNLIESLQSPLSNTNLEEKKYNYLTSPEEVRERISRLRFAGTKRDVYDPFNQEATMEDLLKLKDTPAFEDLNTIYDEDEILKLLNTISQAEPQQQQEQMFFAKKGGKVPVKKHQNADNPLLPFSAEKWAAYRAGEITLLELSSDSRHITNIPDYQDRYDFNTTTKYYENQDKPTIDPITQRLINEIYYPESLQFGTATSKESVAGEKRINEIFSNIRKLEDDFNEGKLSKEDYKSKLDAYDIEIEKLTNKAIGNYTFNPYNLGTPVKLDAEQARKNLKGPALDYFSSGDIYAIPIGDAYSTVYANLYAEEPELAEGDGNRKLGINFMEGDGYAALNDYLFPGTDKLAQNYILSKDPVLGLEDMFGMNFVDGFYQIEDRYPHDVTKEQFYLGNPTMEDIINDPGKYKLVLQHLKKQSRGPDTYLFKPTGIKDDGASFQMISVPPGQPLELRSKPFDNDSYTGPLIPPKLDDYQYMETKLQRNPATGRLERMPFGPKYPQASNYAGTHNLVVMDKDSYIDNPKLPTSTDGDKMFYGLFPSVNPNFINSAGMTSKAGTFQQDDIFRIENFGGDVMDQILYSPEYTGYEVETTTATLKPELEKEMQTFEEELQKEIERRSKIIDDNFLLQYIGMENLSDQSFRTSGGKEFTELVDNTGKSSQGKTLYYYEDDNGDLLYVAPMTRWGTQNNQAGEDQTFLKNFEQFTTKDGKLKKPKMISERDNPEKFRQFARNAMEWGFENAEGGTLPTFQGQSNPGGGIMRKDLMPTQEYKIGGEVVKLQDAFDQRKEAKFYPLLDNRKGVMQNPGGTVSTHRLSHEYIPELGGWVVFPTLFQKSSGEYYESDDPIREAINRKELYRFGDDWKSATRLALGSFKPFVNRNR